MISNHKYTATVFSFLCKSILLFSAPTFAQPLDIRTPSTTIKYYAVVDSGVYEVTDRSNGGRLDPRLPSLPPTFVTIDGKRVRVEGTTDRVAKGERFITRVDRRIANEFKMRNTWSIKISRVLGERLQYIFLEIASDRPQVGTIIDRVNSLPPELIESNEEQVVTSIGPIVHDRTTTTRRLRIGSRPLREATPPSPNPS
jgi:hypothetical protein